MAEFTVDDFYAFMADPVLMHYVLFGRQIPPHQSFMLRAMWWRPLYADTSGYRTGKSSIATYCQMQQCAMISGWHSGIFSHSLRGSQILFREHIEYEYNNNPSYRALIAKKPTHNASGWRIEYKNGSDITAFPADVLGKGRNLESLSLHGATIDEATAVPDPDLIWNVMMNRITKPPPPLARELGIINTMRIIGAAKYAFQPIYQSKEGKGGLIQMVIRRMLEYAVKGDKQALMEYFFNSVNLSYLPEDAFCYCGSPTQYIGTEGEASLPFVKCRKCGMKRIAWQEFFKGALARMRDAESLMNAVLYAMRWLGIWQLASEMIYPGHAVQNMRRPNCRIEIRRSKAEPNAIFAMGIDVGQGKQQESSLSAITILKRVPPDPHYYIVFSKKYRVTLGILSGIIYSLYERFNPSVIMIDPGGGGNWLADSDHLSGRRQTILTNAGQVTRETTPLISMDAPPDVDGARVVQLWSPKMKIMADSIGAKSWPDELMNWAHITASDLITDARVLRPSESIMADGTTDYICDTIYADIEEAADGLPQIGIVQDESGSPLLTSNGFFQYYPKPDLAYSLVYAICAMYLITHDQTMIPDDDDSVMAMVSSALDKFGVSRTPGRRDEIPAEENEPMIIVS